MPFVFGILLALATGYFLGPVVFLIFAVLVLSVPLWFIGKALYDAYGRAYFKRMRERRRIRKVLRERLKWLP